MDDVLPNQLALGKVQDISDQLRDVPTGYVQALQHLEARLQFANCLWDSSVCAVWLQLARMALGGG